VHSGCQVGWQGASGSWVTLSQQGSAHHPPVM
jgi:hypothetical protein